MDSGASPSTFSPAEVANQRPATSITSEQGDTSGSIPSSSPNIAHFASQSDGVASQPEGEVPAAIPPVLPHVFPQSVIGNSGFAVMTNEQLTIGLHSVTAQLQELLQLFPQFTLQTTVVANLTDSLRLWRLASLKKRRPLCPSSWWRGMVCGMRLSKQFLEEVKRISEKNRVLYFIEIMIPSFAHGGGSLTHKCILSWIILFIVLLTHQARFG